MPGVQPQGGGGGGVLNGARRALYSLRVAYRCSLDVCCLWALYTRWCLVLFGGNPLSEGGVSQDFCHICMYVCMYVYMYVVHKNLPFQLSPLHPFHTERLIRIETQINVGFCVHTATIMRI